MKKILSDGRSLCKNIFAIFTQDGEVTRYL